MNWDDLKIVLAINRTGSMSKAARSLEMDQSTVARRLAAIEADLGAVLFARSSTGLASNEAGRVVIAHALAIERSTQQIHAQLPHRLEVPQGSVRLLSNPWVLTHLAANGLKSLRDKFPDIELVMIADTQRRSIARGETDLALFFELSPSDGEIATFICEVPYALYGPTEPSSSQASWMTIWNVKEQIDPMRWAEKNIPENETFALKANDPPVLLAAIQAGLGKALIPVCVGEKATGAIRLGAAESDVNRRLHLHSHPDVTGSPHIQSVIMWLLETCPYIFSGSNSPDPTPTR